MDLVWTWTSGLEFSCLIQEHEVKVMDTELLDLLQFMISYMRCNNDMK